MQGPVRSRGSLSLVPEYGFLCYSGCIASQDEVRLLLLSLYLLFALRNEGPHVGMASGTDHGMPISDAAFGIRKSNNVADRKSKFDGFDRESIAEKLG